VLNVVRLIRDVGLDPVLEPRNPAGHDCIEEKCDGSLCNCLVPVNVLIGGSELFDERRTLGHQVGTMIAPGWQGESVGVGKAMGFHQNLPRGVQPKMGLIVTRLPNLRTHTIVDLQRAQVQLDRVNCSFDACFEEGGDFRPGVIS